MAFTVAVVQNKGGCGKTTLATTLYATAVCRGESAGIIDLDPQGNATAWCVGRASFIKVKRGEGAAALCGPNGTLTADRFRGNQLRDEVPHAAIPCGHIAGGFVVPANPYMDRTDMASVELDNVPFQTLLVDTPPFMCSTLFRSVVAQSDVVVVPIQPEPYCVQNVAGLVAEIENAGGGELLETGRVRFVFNMVQKALTHASWQAVVAAQWGHLVSPVSIPRAMAWADLSNYATKWNPKSKPAGIINELWADIFNQTSGRAAA
jgi:cellulose biosynthesis protein BcsQ